ncbi:twin-arginine translocation signal domain-containing protein [Streptomyces sp. NPDC057798]|uniref:twin-arginine translocation signal domain-containing protein n=1 Tax=Streptomyces sp. NPDC057798 TaxID=3346252 RepID=UPI003681FA03
MSSISRRSLLGYSGTTAAGAVLGTAASAQPAQAAEAGAEATAFDPHTFFKGRTYRTIGDDTHAEVEIEFRVANHEVPSASAITPLEIAELLSELAASRGWPPITFYGTPAPAPLN